MVHFDVFSLPEQAGDQFHIACAISMLGRSDMTDVGRNELELVSLSVLIDQAALLIHISVHHQEVVTVLRLSHSNLLETSDNLKLVAENRVPEKQ